MIPLSPLKTGISEHPYPAKTPLMIAASFTFSRGFNPHVTPAGFKIAFHKHKTDLL